MPEDKGKDTTQDAKKAAGGAAGGGLKAMLPLILTVLLMPALAYAMTRFVLVPKLQKAIVVSAATVAQGDEAAAPADPAPEHAETGKEKTPAAHGTEGTAKPLAKGAKATWNLPKVIVNVKDTQATRYLMSSYTLVGKGDDFKNILDANVDQIRDVTSGVLSTKGIQDLEKTDARSIIKSELIAAINTALGKPAVQEIYITEFAIQ
jgi:flagellar basal body-associated protein FliL